MAGFVGGDAEGMIRLAATLERCADELWIERVAIDSLLDGGWGDVVITGPISVVESWCREERDDILRRVLLLDAGDPIGWFLDTVAVPAAIGDVVRRTTGWFATVDRFLGPLGVAANLHAVIDPPHDGWLGAADRTVAAAGALGGAAEYSLVVGVAATAPEWAGAAVLAASAWAAGWSAWDNREEIADALDAVADFGADVADWVDGAVETADAFYADLRGTACEQWPTMFEPVPDVIHLDDGASRLCGRLTQPFDEGLRIISALLP